MPRLMTAEQVCRELNITIYTLNNWYRFRKEYPDDELAKLLPDFQKEHWNSPRYWKKTDIKKLMKFKETRKLGCEGQMSKTLQKYYKKKEKVNAEQVGTIN